MSLRILILVISQGIKVKANRLIEVVETPVKLTDKEIYYKKNGLFLSFLPKIQHTL